MAFLAAATHTSHRGGALHEGQPSFGTPCKLGFLRILTLRTGNFFLALVAMFLTASSVSAETSREYQITAAFLYNFAQFTEWPSQAFPEKDSPLVIGDLAAIHPFAVVLP